MPLPAYIEDKPSSPGNWPIRNNIKKPTLLQDSSSSNLFLGASNMESEPSDFTMKKSKLTTNQNNPWPYTFTDSTANDESIVNLNELGIQDDYVGISGDIPTRDAFMTINDQIVIPSESTEVVNNKRQTGQKLKMSVSGKFVDHSNKPILRVKTKFVDNSAAGKPEVKTKTVSVDKLTKKPFTTQPEAGSQGKQSLPAKDLGNTFELLNRIPGPANPTGDSNINFVDLAANTPENVGQYTTTTVGESVTTERGNTTPATTTTPPLNTDRSNTETKASIPRSTNLKIESLYPEAPFPISNTANSLPGNSDNSATPDSKSEDKSTTAINAQSNSDDNLNRLDNESPSLLDSSLTNTNSLSNKNNDLSSTRNNERMASDNVKLDNNNGNSHQSDKITSDTQGLDSNVHVPFVTHHAVQSGNVDQFKTDPNVQIINQGGVNGSPVNPNSLLQGSQRVPDVSNINGQQINANGVERPTGRTSNAGQILNFGQGQRIIGQTGSGFGQTSNDFQSSSMSLGRMAGTRSSPYQFNQPDRSGFQNVPGSSNTGQNSFMNANAFNGASRDNVGSQFQNNAMNFPANRVGNGLQVQNGGFPTQSSAPRQNLNRQFSGNTMNSVNDFNRNGLPTINRISENSNSVGFNGQQPPNNIRQQINDVGQRFGTGTGQNSQFASSGNMNNRPITNLPSRNSNQLPVLNNQPPMSNMNSDGLASNVQNDFRNVPSSNSRQPVTTSNGVNNIPSSQGQRPLNNNIGSGRDRAVSPSIQADLGNAGVRSGAAGPAINSGDAAANPNLISRNTMVPGSSGMDLGTSPSRTMPVNSESSPGRANSVSQNTNSIGASSTGMSSQDKGFNDRFSLGIQKSGRTNINPQVPTQNNNGNSNFIGNFPQNPRGPLVGQQQFPNSFSSPNIGNGMAQNTNRISQMQTAVNRNGQSNSMMMTNNMNTFSNNNFRNPPFGSQQRNRQGPLQDVSSFQNGLQSQRNNFFPSPQNSRSFTDNTQKRFNNFVNRNVQPMPTNFQSAPFGGNLNQLNSQQALLSRARGFPATQQQFLQRNSMNTFTQNRQVMPFG